MTSQLQPVSSFSGKAAFVTGAASGIGFVLTKVLFLLREASKKHIFGGQRVLAP